ncbi:MAG: metallophosphoesterase [Hyphomicrobium sp.]|uniref:metallophosphoesterase n=1 Tax=Hyphomicrobium sp. TaxID=82 RepID=UPI0025C02ACC|nr:metallophosphoesterase [Hyphomicrobium sp.]MBZ0211606.1 metallophosphoesterase [Hyphomicrobium sp.]
MSTPHEPAATDWRDVHGPLDIIGDVHGCADELVELLHALGYTVRLEGTGDSRSTVATTPRARRAFFVGDLVDRGPNAPDVLRIVMDMVERGQALSIVGNHDDKFVRWLKGRDVKIAHGLERTIAQLDGEGEAIRTRALAFLDELPSHALLDDGHLAVAHAGIRESMLGKRFRRAHDFGLYGDSSGRLAADGLPERFNWAAEYRGKTAIVYGHTPVAEPEWLNNTLCIDTGCVFGGRLTALRWPEREIISVTTKQTYADLKREFGLPPPRPPGQAKR